MPSKTVWEDDHTQWTDREWEAWRRSCEAVERVGYCRVCAQTVVITSRGRLRVHYDGRVRCGGSGEHPVPYPSSSTPV